MSHNDDGNPPADDISRLDAPSIDKLIPESVLRTQILGISQPTLWRIQDNIRQGGDPDQLPPSITLNKLRYYHPTAITAWIARRQTNDLGYMRFVDLPPARKMIVVTDHLSVLDNILADGPARDRYNVLVELMSRDAAQLDHIFDRASQLLVEAQTDSAISQLSSLPPAERRFWAPLEDEDERL